MCAASAVLARAQARREVIAAWRANSLRVTVARSRMRLDSVAVTVTRPTVARAVADTGAVACTRIRIVV